MSDVVATGSPDPDTDGPAGHDRAPEDPLTTAVLGCDGVVGVRSTDADGADVVRVRVVVRYGTALTELGDRVGAALGDRLAGRPLQLDVVDVVA